MVIYIQHNIIKAHHNSDDRDYTTEHINKIFLQWIKPFAHNKLSDKVNKVFFYRITVSSRFLALVRKKTINRDIYLYVPLSTYCA